ncbi:MAG TPA: YceH family protein [Clostridia bacterium]|nr:YceH family protein [Clostridia bacterium]
MDIRLNDAEVRVLGALVEKDITTPDYYPLSLNALVNACNQRSNREPVMDLDEDAVRQALHALAEHRLAGPAGGADSRVTKYEHRLQEVYNFDRREIAVLCVLLLRGPQTPGELRGRTERMYPFEDLSQVQSTMQRLIDREPPLVSILPRQPGTKEARYMHLFGGDGSAGLGSDVSVVAAQAHSTASAGSNGERSSRLEDELALLRQEVDDLKRQFAEFRKQFE